MKREREWERENIVEIAIETNSIRCNIMTTWRVATLCSVLPMASDLCVYGVREHMNRLFTPFCMVNYAYELAKHLYSTAQVIRCFHCKPITIGCQSRLALNIVHIFTLRQCAYSKKTIIIRFVALTNMLETRDREREAKMQSIRFSSVQNISFLY